MRAACLMTSLVLFTVGCHDPCDTDDPREALARALRLDGAPVTDQCCGGAAPALDGGAGPHPRETPGCIVVEPGQAAEFPMRWSGGPITHVQLGFGGGCTLRASVDGTTSSGDLIVPL